ncbi:cytochrome c biogenesis protein ResB [Ectothiorhodospira mobilis]|uniref:cytochrome c biogenesis protein ResB n=1 Tax=Ectothiorhodospira mobilis TaxID=195064 RepID=UPI001EE7A974|nr:cytochrome c biogenesis protein ResB [Ectothiorhodospira mobilis]MCG5536694.1 cytochrome c biogenesis protein ResB [Ectothiorhodospira mobilis]
MSSDVPAAPRPSRWSVLIGFLGSMHLAIALLLTLALAAALGTVLPQNQPSQTYLMQFGPFWHEVFDALGLYGVYTAGWFLLILAFLVVSTTVCVYRSTPMMWRDMRGFRLDIREKSLERFAHKESRPHHPEAPDTVMQRAQAVLQDRGYRLRRRQDADGREVLSAMRGGGNRLGYFFTHVAIVVICIGGLIDGRVPLMAAQLLGGLEPETRQIPASEVPPKSRVEPSNPSFRGSVEIPEGRSADVVFLDLGDGYVVQELPFAIEVKDFRVQRHENGQERSYESDVVIHDDTLEAPMERTVSVNHPLVHRGYAIYQSSYRDAGSLLMLDMHLLGHSAEEPRRVPVRVHGRYEQSLSDGSVYTLEFLNFRETNLSRERDEEGGERVHDMGPSMEYALYGPDGETRYFHQLMEPVERDGRRYLISGVRAGTGEPFRYLYIPVDPDGEGVDRFMALVARLHDRQVVESVVDEVAGEAAKQFGGEDGRVPREVVRNTMIRLMELFATGGYDAVIGEIRQRVPEPQWDRLTDVFGRVLNETLRALYLRVLEAEGIAEMRGDDAAWLDDALTALDALPRYGSPLFVRLRDYQLNQAAGLMVTKAPGQKVVYFGSLMLIIGVFLMLYVSHRRCWLVVQPRGDGGSRLLFAGTANRNMLEFDNEFAALNRDLLQEASAGGENGAGGRQAR